MIELKNIKGFSFLTSKEFIAGVFFGQVAFLSLASVLFYLLYFNNFSLSRHFEEQHTEMISKIKTHFQEQDDWIDKQLQIIQAMKREQHEAITKVIKEKFDQNQVYKIINDAYENASKKIADDINVLKEMSLDFENKKMISEKSFVLACQAFHDNELNLAGFYFSNALMHNPGDWEMLSSYARMILDWEKKEIVDASEMNSENMLSEFSQFLLNQIPMMHPDNIVSAISLRDEIQEFISAKEGIFDFEETSENLLSQASEILSSNANGGLDEAGKIESISSLIEKMEYRSDPSHPGIREAIVKLQERRNQLIQSSQFSNIIEQANDLMDRCKNLNYNENLIFYYLSSLEQIVRNLVLMNDDLPLSDSQKIDDLVNRFESLTKAIAKQKSVLVMQEIEENYNGIKGYLLDQCRLERVDNASYDSSNCQTVINALTNFIQLNANRLSEISDEEIHEKAKKMLVEVNLCIEKWRQEQQRLYEEWAVMAINYFYDNCIESTGFINDDEDSIYQQMRTSLSPIDVRYLSSPGASCYNEAFHFFYQKLSNKQKIDITLEMALAERKSLVEF